MLYPVSLVNPSQLCTPQASASTILNYGPGNIYVYRNAAVNRIGAYDAVVGPGGTFQWPGGELWAVADAAGTTVNVLAGATAVNTGSTSISGVVTTASASGGSSNTAAIRAGTTSSYGNSVSVTINTPSGTQVGDLLVAFAVTGYGGNAPVPSGWSAPRQLSNQTSYYTWAVCMRTATSADAAGGASYTFTGGTYGGSPTAVVMYALNGPTTYRAGSESDSNPSASTNINAASVNTGVMFAASLTTNQCTDTYSWGSSPPNPAPTITAINKTCLVVASAIPQYTVANPYTLNVSGNGNTRDLLTCAFN